MEKTKLILSILPETMGICHFDKKSPFPEWALKEERFVCFTRTRNELSIICPEDIIPGGVLFEKGWKAFKLESIGDIYSVGIIASLAKPLAESGISIFNISTYETNYLLLEEKNLEKAREILSEFCQIKE